MKKILFLLGGWLNHVSAILIMSQGVGISFAEKSALEQRASDLRKEIDNFVQGTKQEKLSDLHTVECDICGNPVFHTLENPLDVICFLKCSTCLSTVRAISVESMNEIVKFLIATGQESIITPEMWNQVTLPVKPPSNGG